MTTERRQLGVYLDIPEEEYHSDTWAASKSMLSTMAKHTPSRLKWEMDHPGWKKITDEMVLGSFTHRMLLEPSRAAFVQQPDSIKQRRGKEWDAFKLECGSAFVARGGEALSAINMRNSIMDHRLSVDGNTTRLGLILDESDKEVSLYMPAPGHNPPEIMRRCRIDILPRRGNVILDLKTTGIGGARPNKFANTMADFEYSIQDAYYTDIANELGLDRTIFVFVVVESEPPYSVACYRVDEESRGRAREEYKRRLAVFSRCQETGIWPGYSETIETVTMPPWGIRNTTPE